MRKALRKTAEQHAVLFWVLSVLFYIVGYKVISVTVLGKTPYSYDIAFFKLALALLAIIMMKSIYGEAFSFHLHTEKMMKGFLLLWPAVLLLANNILKTTIHPNQIVAETLLMVTVSNMITGFYEEIIVRGMLLGHMMKHWKNDEKKILRAAVATSLLFGIVHLGNLVYGNAVETIFQVIYATIIGLVFAASYLRTKNLWACILIHGFTDVTSALYKIHYLPGEEIPDVIGGFQFMQGGFGLLFLPISFLIALVVALYELRKKKRPEISELWNEDRIANC